MLTRNDLKILYEWAKNTKFPCKKAPTIDGYCNKVIDYYWLKSVKKSTIIRQKYMSDEVYEIYKNENILFSNYTSDQTRINSNLFIPMTKNGSTRN